MLDAEQRTARGLSDQGIDCAHLESSILPFDEKYAIASVHFLQLHFDDFVAGGLHDAANERRLDGKFAVAAINEDTKLHTFGAALSK
jgi:hypothetical protein